MTIDQSGYSCNNLYYSKTNVMICLHMAASADGPILDAILKSHLPQLNNWPLHFNCVHIHS